MIYLIFANKTSNYTEKLFLIMDRDTALGFKLGKYHELVQRKNKWNKNLH